MLRSTTVRELFGLISPRLCRGFATTANAKLGKNPRQSRGLPGGLVRFTFRRCGAFTLIEMLVAMAITLVMMGAVVTLFANISNSVRNRRATTEMSGQLRHVRNVLQQDLQGATCPGVTWQRPESNHGYIEIIEGQYHEGYATNLIDADPTNVKSGTWPPTILNPEIDHKASTLPSSNLAFKDSTWATDAAGLGDADDVLMLTVRNEHEPFNGRVPKAYSYIGNEALSCVRLDDKKANTFDKWTLTDSIRSPLAEVVWFAMENPGYTDDGLTDPTANHFFGEPGMRTIYRRTLLIAPWLNPYRYVAKDGTVSDSFSYDGGTFKAQPGLMRILPKQIALEDAIAAVIAFQDRYDLSVRLEWDGDVQRWKIVANTLGDLTKRENRFCHFGYLYGPSTSIPPARVFPFQFVSMGSDYTGSKVDVAFANDPEAGGPSATAKAAGYLTTLGTANKTIGAYGVDDTGSGYKTRPFVYIPDRPKPTAPAPLAPATAQAMLNDDGAVVRIVHGPVPLWGARRGEDVMMTDVLAFDLRVYDPGAPMFATVKTAATSTTTAQLDTVITPSDPGWRGSPLLNGTDGAYMDADNMGNAKGIYDSKAPRYQYVGQGAYVDMGYGSDPRFSIGSPPSPTFPEPYYKDPASSFMSATAPWFFSPRGLCDVYGNSKSPGYCVYDTWSFHYENNGVDEDVNGVVDQGTNGLDDKGNYYDPVLKKIVQDIRLGIDDVGERETTPPYDKPLRGMQALIRTYEHDSRAIRQVRVNQHFMQE